MSFDLDKPQRRGSSRRIPDSQKDSHELYQRVQVTLDPETYKRLQKYCEEQERARSWVIQKAVAEWLNSKGY